MDDCRLGGGGYNNYKCQGRWRGRGAILLDMTPAEIVPSLTSVGGGVDHP